jgi:hypothetical protein
MSWKIKLLICNLATGFVISILTVQMIYRYSDFSNIGIK